MNRTMHATLLTLMFASGVALAPAQEVALPVDPPAAAPSRPGTAIDALAASGEHKKMVEAINAAGLAGAMNAINPLTVFAPTDSAFSSSTYMSFSDLMKDDNRGKLVELLRYHVVAGAIDTASLDARIEAGGGSAVLTTVQGGTLTVRRSGDEYTITDATNHTARISTKDLYQRNGVVQVIDQVLMPNTPP
jgi:uncharacterized surface protein with fasciclin (FAS1) repeats